VDAEHPLAGVEATARPQVLFEQLDLAQEPVDPMGKTL
jgi:hypothetical protein